MWYRAADASTEIEESANSLWESTLDAVPRVGVSLGIVLVGWVVARGLRWLLHRYFRRRQTPSFARVMSKLLSWIFVGVVTLVALAITFPSVKPVDILAGLGFFSVAVGFAFQDILENTLAGVLLLFRQPFRAGDQIEVMDQSGTVEGITIRETRIVKYDGELVVIPNRDVYKNNIVVHTYQPDHRQRFVVGIAYESDAREATEVIAAALATVPGVRSHPEPVALVEELGVSTVDIAALFWTDAHRFDSITVKDAAITTVKEHLEAAGIEMPADIVALQATPSFAAALRDGAGSTPAGNERGE